MALMRWDGGLVTGHALLDAQHEELVTLVNGLADAIRSRAREEALGTALEALVRHTIIHFRTEEDLMLGAGYAGYVVHKQKHDDLLAKATHLIDVTRAQGLSLSITLPDFLACWVRHHIEDEDVALVAFLRAEAEHTTVPSPIKPRK
jgi:hemerythrin